MPHPTRRRRTTALLAAGAFGAASLASVGVASAHVVAGIDAIDGATSTVVFSFDHGCNGAATTGIEALFPSSTTDVAPVDVDGWTSEVDETGSGVVVSWTGGSVPDHTQMSFTVDVTFGEPDGTLVKLPTIQSCGDDELAWIDEDPDAAYPAPAVVVGQTGSAPGGHSHDDGDDGHGDDGEADEPHDDGATPDDATEDATTDDDAVEEDTQAPQEAEAQTTAEQASEVETGANAGGTTGLVVLIVVVLIIAGGATALYLRNRGGTSPPPAS